MEILIIFLVKSFNITMAESKLDVWDFIAIAAYFTAVIGTGIYVSLRFIIIIEILISKYR